MKIPEILEITKDWSEPDIAQLLRALNLRRDMITRVWDYTLGKVPTLFERDQTTNLITEYGYDAVRQAFGECGLQAEKSKHGLPYIKAILKKQKEQASIKKQKEEARELAKVTAEIAGTKAREKTDLDKPLWKAGMFKDILGK